MTSSAPDLDISDSHLPAPTQALHESVAQSLQNYFNKLDGHAPEDLYRLVIEEVERPLLDAVMRYCKGNQTKAAQYLGLNRGTLRKKIKQYDLS